MPSRAAPSSELPKREARALEKRLGYAFRDRSLLVKSLTHPSYLLKTSEQLNNNQRLEFLGDSVIQLALTEALYLKRPDLREGQLTAIRAGFACGSHMAKLARELKLQDCLLLKEKDRLAGVADQDSALADAFESLLGAVYLDGGWEAARAVALRLYGQLDADAMEEGAIPNPKGRLQELIQPALGNGAIEYRSVSVEGDPHDRVFEIAALCNGRELGRGRGRSKKEASENAAREAIESWTSQRR